MKKWIIFFAVWLSANLSGVAQTATEQIEDSTTHVLDEVVLTAQRNKQQIFLVPYSVSSISNNFLNEFSPRTVPEALMGMNGVFMQKTNHAGGSPFVRGVTGNQTLILVDGIRLNNSTFRYGPNQYLNTIDVYTINQIEVAKGTGSVQYGTDAIGGVVQLLTKDPVFADSKPDFQGKAIAKYMTGDMEKTIRAEADYSGEKFAFLGGISHRRFGDLVGGDTTGTQISSGYNEWAFDAKAKMLLSQNTQLTLANQFLQQQNVPVYHKLKLENYAVNEMDPQQRLLNYARINTKNKSRLFSETEITLSWQQTIEERNSRKNGSTALRKEKDIINTIGLTADVFSQPVKYWTANSGIELYYDKVASTRKDINTQKLTTISLRGLYPDDSRYGNYAVYSMHHFKFKRWIVDAGIRFNTFSIHINDTTLGNVKISPSAWVGNAAVLYRLAHNQHIYSSVSNGYRAPNVDDMGTLGIVDFRYEIPTANLSPEKSVHTEVGYKVKKKYFSGTLVAYYMHLNNLITRVNTGDSINGYKVYKKENTDAAYIKGFETEMNWHVTSLLSLTGSAAYTYGQNLSKNEPLRRIPPFNGRLMSMYKKNMWFAAAEVQFACPQKRLAQGDKDDNRIPVGGTPGWKSLNFFGGYSLQTFKINAGIQNILNEDYRTHGSGINAVGRSAWISLNIIF